MDSNLLPLLPLSKQRTFSRTVEKLCAKNLLTASGAFVYNLEYMKHKTALTAKQKRFLYELVGYIQREKRPPTTRELQAIMDFSSPRSVTQFLQALEEHGYVSRSNGARNISVHKPSSPPPSHEGKTVPIPIVGIAPCGLPLLAEQNVEGHVRVSTRVAAPPHTYFALQTIGNSMNKAGIRSGDLVIVRKQQTARDGDRVVALIDDEATIKVLRIQTGAALLLPKSTDKSHKPILVSTNFQVQGVVVATVQDWKKGKVQ